MIVEQPSLPRLADLENTIRDRILQRTCGRIRSLEVEATDCHVIVRGGAASYHLKQLAIQGLIDAIGTCDRTRLAIDVQIVVGSARTDGNGGVR